MSEDIHRTNPPINAMDFGVPPLFAERAENYARWAVQAEREACAKVCDKYTHGQWFARAIRARKP